MVICKSTCCESFPPSPSKLCVLDWSWELLRMQGLSEVSLGNGCLTSAVEVDLWYERLIYRVWIILSISGILQLFDRVEHWYPTAIKKEKKITQRTQNSTSTWSNFRFKTQAVSLQVFPWWLRETTLTHLSSPGLGLAFIFWYCLGWLLSCFHNVSTQTYFLAIFMNSPISR